MWAIYMCFLILLHGSRAVFEGQVCEKKGRQGTCVRFWSCQSAKVDVMYGRPVQECGKVDTESIVCCLDKNPSVPAPNLASTIIPLRRPVTMTPKYYPETEEYIDVLTGIRFDSNSQVCPPVSADLTAPKNGRKSWDKCIEYQEQLVYPCVHDVATSALSSKTRSRKCPHSTTSLIIGGQDAETHEYPHMALLGYGSDNRDIEWYCGGSLISERFILTAGHCISNKDVGRVTHVLVGAYQRNEVTNSSKVFRVKTIIKHPEYAPPSVYNDITLLELDRDVPLSSTTVPACLHAGEPVDDARVAATGWGLTHDWGQVSEKLQKVILDKFSTSHCSSVTPISRNVKLGFNEETQLCYGDKGVSRNTCYGDSGGPIQIKSADIKCMYMIVGVTSYGKGSCGVVGATGIYTRVAPYVPWIESIVWS